MSFRGVYRKGEFIIGGTYSADLAARAETQRRVAPARGDFVTSDGRPIAFAKAEPLPHDLEHFADVVAAAGPLRADLGLIEHKIDALRDAVRKARAK